MPAVSVKHALQGSAALRATGSRTIGCLSGGRLASEALLSGGAGVGGGIREQHRLCAVRADVEAHCREIDGDTSGAQPPAALMCTTYMQASGLRVGKGMSAGTARGATDQRAAPKRGRLRLRRRLGREGRDRQGREGDSR